jgi:O-antigen/teichoic acid export membrane protein
MGLIGVAFVPLYVGYIGVESYGIVGFFAMLQALYSLLDMGLSATLGREIAVASADGNVSVIPTLLRTFELIYLPMGFFIGIATWLLSDWVAVHWLKPVTLSAAEAAAALALLGVSAALQWPASLYIAGLTGLQRQVRLNSLRIAISTISAFGCLAALMHRPTLSTYLNWQIASSAAQSLLFAWALYAVLPGRGVPAKFSITELHRIRSFAGGVMLITLLSLALTQADRFVLSRLLPLDRFGHYALAAALAAVVYRLVQPLYLAYGPRFAELATQGNEAELSRQYHLANQMMAMVLGPVMAMSLFFGHDIVMLWSRDATIALEVAPVFSALVVAWSLHGLMNLPYALQLAYGWTSLSVGINLGSVLFVLPLFWFLGATHGGFGIALGWVFLTVIYVILGPTLMHRRLLRGAAMRWYVRDVGPVVVASLAAAALLSWWLAPLPSGLAGWLQLTVASAIVFGAAFIAARQVFSLARALLGRLH